MFTWPGPSQESDISLNVFILRSYVITHSNIISQTPGFLALLFKYISYIPFYLYLDFSTTLGRKFHEFRFPDCLPATPETEPGAKGSLFLAS